MRGELPNPDKRFFSTQCSCHTDLWLHGGSHQIISIIFNLSPLQHPLKKSKMTLFVGCHSAPFGRSLGSLKPFSNFHLRIFGHRSRSTASLPDYHENQLTWADSSLVVPPWVAFGHHSLGPASPPDYHKNHLIWADSILRKVIPLSFPWASFVGWSLLILYCTLLTFCSFVDCIFSDVVSLIHFCLNIIIAVFLVLEGVFQVFWSL